MPMIRPFFGVLLLVCGLAGVGCSGDDDDDDDSSSGGTSTAGSSSSGGSNSSGGGGAVSDRCREGCVLTLEADCALGPDTQEQCETDCQELEMGQCSDEYDAFQDCAEEVGELTCVPPGIPGAEGCEAEQQAFIACLQ